MIRIINYTVTKESIDPAARQPAGIQGEHNAVQLKFKLDEKLYSAVCAQKKEGDSLRFRFDAFGGAGGAVRTGSEELTGDTVVYNIPSALSGEGGNANVFLIITLLRGGNTEIELMSYPARLYFTPSEDGTEETDRESMTALEQKASASAEAAAESAASAAEAKAAAEEAKVQTAAARAAIESGSEFLFDGGGADESLIVECVTDPSLSETSGNPVANKAISARFKQVDTAVAAKADSSAVSSAISAAIEAAKAGIISSAKTAALDAAHPVGSIYLSVSETSPAAAFGGVWERIAKGRALIGAMLSSDADYDADFAPLSTGGEKNHTLTADEMPADIGTFRTLSWSADKTCTGKFSCTNYAVSDLAQPAAGELWGTSEYKLSGGGQAHNNMPPYLAVYIWKRVS